MLHTGTRKEALKKPQFLTRAPYRHLEGAILQTTFGSHCGSHCVSSAPAWTFKTVVINIYYMHMRSVAAKELNWEYQYAVCNRYNHTGI